MTEKTTSGYMGRVLRVDLSREKISEESLDNKILREYLGGTGLGTKYLYEEVPAGVEWSDADNRIMFLPALLEALRSVAPVLSR